MKTTIVGLFLLGLVFLIPPAVADHGEYLPPEGRTSAPGKSNPTGGGKGVPTPSPGKVSTPKLGGPETTPTPGAVSREDAISWELVWELVRSAEPEALQPPVPAPPKEHPILDALRNALTHESLEVRTWAALALGRSGRSRQVLEQLAADGELMRTPAVLVLGWPEHTEADRRRSLVLLKSVIEDPEVPSVVRLAAITAVGMLGPSGANLLLRTLSRSPTEPTRSACLFALGQSGHPGARDVLVPAVLPAETDDDPVARALVVRGLSLLPGPEAGRDVMKRLRDPAVEVRTAAALSLTSRVREMPSARRALLDLAQNGATRPRSAALLALVLGGDPAASDLCRTVLSKPAGRDPGFLALAALGLGLSRAALAGPDLVKIAGGRSLDRNLRCAAAVAAGLVRARGWGKELRKIAAGERDPVVAGYAFIGAMMIEPTESAAALKALGKEKRRRGRELIVQALGHAATPDVVAVLVERLGDDYEVNREAARSLFRTDPGRGVTEMGVRLTVRKNPFARRYAAIILGGALDRTRPSRLARHVLGVGLDARHPLTELLLYLESDILHGRWGKR